MKTIFILFGLLLLAATVRATRKCGEDENICFYGYSEDLKKKEEEQNK